MVSRRDMILSSRWQRAPDRSMRLCSTHTGDWRLLSGGTYSRRSEALIFAVHGRRLHKYPGVHVNRVRQADSIHQDGAINVQRQAQAQASLIIQDIAAGPAKLLEVEIQDFAEGVARRFRRRAFHVMLMNGANP